MRSVRLAAILTMLLFAHANAAQDAGSRLLALWEERYFAPDIPELVLSLWHKSARPPLVLAESVQQRYDEYMQAHAKLIEDVRSRLIAHVEQSQGQRPTGLAEMGDELRAAKQRMAQQFVEDVNLLLDDDDDARGWWHAIVRQNTRDRALPMASVNDPTRWSIDLVAVVDGAEFAVPDRVEISDVLFDYERSMDEALVELTTQTRAIARRMRETTDIEKRGALTRQLIVLHETVAAVNRRYADLIHDRLPPGAAAVFTERLQERRYPELFRLSPVQIALQRIEQSALPVEVTMAVEEIAAAYESEASALRTAMIAANDRWYSKEARVRRDENVADGETNYMELYAQHPGLEALRMRRDLERSTIRMIRDCVNHLWDELDFEIRMALSTAEHSDG